MIRGVLAAVALALAGTLFMQWHDWPPSLSPDEIPGHDPVATADAGKQDGNLPTTATLPETKETYASISERPLFRPQRKPEPPQTEQSEKPPVVENDGSLEGLDLSAVVISPRVTSAWIKDPSTPALKRLRLGDEQAGWSVKSILADRIVFERQGETNELILQDFTQSPPSSGNAPAPVRPTRPTPVRPDGAPRKTPLPPRGPPSTQLPAGKQRGAPPIPPQPRPNVPKPPQQRPQ
jgi:general secretion pathway protein N